MLGEVTAKAKATMLMTAFILEMCSGLTFQFMRCFETIFVPNIHRSIQKLYNYENDTKTSQEK
jgi:hypothetical protein